VLNLIGLACKSKMPIGLLMSRACFLVVASVCVARELNPTHLRIAISHQRYFWNQTQPKKDKDLMIGWASV
jgi:hypothetical protein